MAQVTIHVPPRPYQAKIENGLLARSGALLAELLPQASKVFVVTVPPVRRRWGSTLLRSLVSAGFKPQILHVDVIDRNSTHHLISNRVWRVSPYGLGNFVMVSDSDRRRTGLTCPNRFDITT